MPDRLPSPLTPELVLSAGFHGEDEAVWYELDALCAVALGWQNVRRLPNYFTWGYSDLAAGSGTSFVPRFSIYLGEAMKALEIFAATGGWTWEIARVGMIDYRMKIGGPGRYVMDHQLGDNLPVLICRTIIAAARQHRINAEAAELYRIDRARQSGTEKAPRN